MFHDNHTILEFEDILNLTDESFVRENVFRKLGAIRKEDSKHFQDVYGKIREIIQMQHSITAIFHITDGKIENLEGFPEIMDKILYIFTSPEPNEKLLKYPHIYIPKNFEISP